MDVISLYACKYFKFPLGQPVIHVGDACQDKEAILQEVRLIKYCVLPPQKLYHPVLPFPFKDRLLFCLCNSCDIEHNGNGE